MLILHHKRNLAKKGGATSIHFGVEQGGTTRLGTRDMEISPAPKGGFDRGWGKMATFGATGRNNNKIGKVVG
jgi:hypothetical protein